MKLVAKFNNKWMLVDTEAKTWEWVERASPDIEEKILHDCTVTGKIVQVTNPVSVDADGENIRDYWKHLGVAD